MNPANPVEQCSEVPALIDSDCPFFLLEYSIRLLVAKEEEINAEAAINYYNLMIDAAKSIKCLETIEEFEIKIKNLSKKE